MTVAEKTSESEYFLERIKQTYSNQNEVNFNFSAFLSSSRSIAEHLLEEYNQKFGLGISVSDKMNANEFRRRSVGNTNAERFIAWFDAQIDQIKNNPVGNLLWEQRNVNIHRTTQRPNHIVVNIHETMTITDSVSAREFPSDMSAEEALRITREDAEREQSEPREREGTVTMTPNNSTVNWHFQELPNLNVIQVSTQFLNLMEKLVSDAHSNFP